MVTSSQTGCRRSQRMLRPPPEREGLCHCPAGWNAPITGRLSASAGLEKTLGSTILHAHAKAPTGKLGRGGARAAKGRKAPTFSRRSVDLGVASVLRLPQTRGSPFTGG